MSPSDLKALLAAEKADALAAASAAKLSADRADAMDYYLGDMAKHMPPADGRSTAVSTDVADTIEGLMPSLMEIFAGSDEVVRFEPVGKEDVAAAEQETDYVNHVFMQKNPGFLVLYGFIKDARASAKRSSSAGPPANHRARAANRQISSEQCIGEALAYLGVVAWRRHGAIQHSDCTPLPCARAAYLDQP